MPFLRAAFLLILALPAVAAAQTRADSALVRRVLVAEDRRELGSSAFTDGMASRNPAVHAIAQRAQARVADSTFATRDSMPVPTAPPKYEDPAWRLRYRALGTRPVDCARVTAGLSDSAWAVALRAADVATAECASDPTLLTTLRRWANTPPDNGHRRAGEPGWRAAAHAIVALAKISPASARTLLPTLAKSRVAGLRTYAARAAGTLADTALLYRLSADRDDNVKEAAIAALARVAGHAADTAFYRALHMAGPTSYQVIRAAGAALKGAKPNAGQVQVVSEVLHRLRSGASETSRDARLPLAQFLVANGEADATPELLAPPAPLPLPADAVALAFGKPIVLRVTLADSSGGGHFDVRLRGDVAPIMAARVLGLVRDRWYDNRTWYRVEPDFVIQGGGPGSNEYVGHPRYERDELSALPQVRGTIGMSTRGHDTGDAQWFVNLKDNVRLTKDYTTFAEVIDGMDVVDGIMEGDVIATIEVLSPAKRRRGDDFAVK